MEELVVRLALDPETASKTIVALFTFQIQINNNSKVKAYTKNNSLLLHHYQKQIAEGVEKIYFPININSNHWIAGVINIPAQSIGYSMNE